MVEHSQMIPREQWPTHPHYPEQVLLLGSHENFRRVSRYLVHAAEAGEDITGIASLYLRWISAMRSHEAYEERKLYPYLARRWQLSFASAQAGHETLHARHDEVVAALKIAAEGGDATPELAEALRRHDHALDEHLEHEEDLVIPRLLELSPDEFQAYLIGRA